MEKLAIMSAWAVTFPENVRPRRCLQSLLLNFSIGCQCKSSYDIIVFSKPRNAGNVFILWF